MDACGLFRETWGLVIAFWAVAALGFFAVLIWRLKESGVPPLRWPDVKYSPDHPDLRCLGHGLRGISCLLAPPEHVLPFVLSAGSYRAGRDIHCKLENSESFLLALAVGFLFCVNLSSSIYPAAQPALNHTELFARSMQDVWKPGTIVYGNAYADENLTIKYFNPQVTWKKLWNRAPLEDLDPILHQLNASGNTLWFDLAELEKFSLEDPAFSDWLKANCHLGETRKFRNAENIVGFVQLVPLESRKQHRAP